MYIKEYLNFLRKQLFNASKISFLIPLLIRQKEWKRIILYKLLRSTSSCTQLCRQELKYILLNNVRLEHMHGTRFLTQKTSIGRLWYWSYLKSNTSYDFSKNVLHVELLTIAASWGLINRFTPTLKYLFQRSLLFIGKSKTLFDFIFFWTSVSANGIFLRLQTTSWMFRKIATLYLSTIKKKHFQ